MNKSGIVGVPPGFEELPCPICETASSQKYIIVRDRLNPSAHRGNIKPQEGSFTVVACTSCGFLYLTPRPSAENLPDYYRTAGYDPHRRTGGGVLGFIFRWVRPLMIHWKVRQVSAGLQPGALLDVGCGTGEFLCAMRASGWQVQGIEVQLEAARVASAAGCPVLVGDPADLNIGVDRFDLITLWHSLEHLPKLKEAVDKIARSLKPGGRLAIAVPNPLSFEAKFYGPLWAAWDAPRHLYHFRLIDLKALLEPAGLCWSNIRALPLDPFYHCLLSEMSWSTGLFKLLRAGRGLIVGMISFLAGLKPAWGSACIYIFERE